MKRSLLALLVVSVAAMGCERPQSSETKGGSQTNAKLASNRTATTVLHFRVTGMHCDGCAQGIKSKLETLQGVVTCDVSFENSAATVTTDDATIAKTVMEKIHEMQYGAERADEAGVTLGSSAADSDSAPVPPSTSTTPPPANPPAEPGAKRG